MHQMVQQLSSKDKAKRQALGFTHLTLGAPWQTQLNYSKIFLSSCRGRERLSRRLIVIAQQTTEKQRLWCCSVWSSHSCKLSARSSQHQGCHSSLPSPVLIRPCTDLSCCCWIKNVAFQLHYEMGKTNVCKDKQDKLYGGNKYRVKEKKKWRGLRHTWNYCKDARREQCMSQNLHVN